MSRFTPSEKLPDLTTAMRAEASPMIRSSSGEAPVDPITKAGPPRPAASRARAAEAAPLEKSMITSQAASAPAASVRVWPSTA